MISEEETCRLDSVGNKVPLLEVMFFYVCHQVDRKGNNVKFQNVLRNAPSFYDLRGKAPVVAANTE